MSPREAHARTRALERRARALGHQREKAQRDLDAALSDIVLLVAEARELAMTVTRFAELVGMSPQALYGLLRRRLRRAFPA